MSILFNEPFDWKKRWVTKSVERGELSGAGALVFLLALSVDEKDNGGLEKAVVGEEKGRTAGWATSNSPAGAVLDGYVVNEGFNVCCGVEVRVGLLPALRVFEIRDLHVVSVNRIEEALAIVVCRVRVSIGVRGVVGGVFGTKVRVGVSCQEEGVRHWVEVLTDCRMEVGPEGCSRREIVGFHWRCIEVYDAKVEGWVGGTF